MNKEYNYKEDQKKFYKEFQKTLMNLLTPVVENLVNHVRTLEKLEEGKGVAEIEKLFIQKDINQPMYNILKESIKDLSKEYEIKLDPLNYLNNKPTDTKLA